MYVCDLHRLSQGAAIGQSVFAEGVEVTATPVLDDITPPPAPVRAHGGGPEGLQEEEVRDMQLPLDDLMDR